MAPMADGVQIQLEAVRAAARTAFETHTAKARAAARAGPPPAPTRPLSPGLREALLLHACRHAAARAFELHVRRLKHSSLACALGSAPPRTEILWRWRRERVMIVAAAVSKPLRVSAQSEQSAPSVGLPDWLRVVRAAACARAQAAAAAAKKSAALTAAAHAVRGALAPLGDTSGYAQHVARAAAAHAAGACALCARDLPPIAPLAGIVPLKKTSSELEAEVVRRYAGMPDELYRRRSGRRFAVHRRELLSAAAGRASVERRAEVEMARRRGADRLRSTEAEPDAPRYVFDGGEHAYVFSSRITQAPRLRSTMLRKYSTPAPQPVAPRLNSLQLAHRCAESRPMFHTRVMNRFG